MVPKVPGVMSPNDTTDEPRKVRPPDHFWKDSAFLLLTGRLRRRANNLDAGPARHVHGEDNVLIGDVRIALYEQDLLRAVLVHFLQPLTQAGLVDRCLVDGEGRAARRGEHLEHDLV